MRKRILRSTLGVSLSVIVLMSVALWWGHWAGATSRAQATVEQEADRVALTIHEMYHSQGAIGEADLEQLLPAGYDIRLQTPDGELEVGSGADGPTSTEYVEGLGVVTLTDTSGALRQSSWLAGVVILAVAALLAALAIVVAVRTSRRLTEPLEDLVQDAQRLGAGDLRPSGHHYGIEELDQLSESLDTAARRVAELLAEERALTLDASHQLKTPLTALSLRLEELAERPDDAAVRAEASAALEQVERLSALVDGLLTRRRLSTATAERSPLRGVIAQQLSEWRPAFDAADRHLTADLEDDGSLSVDRGPVGQVVAALIENSLLHGGGPTTVEVRSRAGITWVDVSDEGPGVPEDLAAHVFDREVSGAGGTGLGLAAAQDAAVSVGGRIALVRRRPARFRFFLDGREHPSPVGPEPEQRPERDADDVGGDVVGQR